jgi:histidine phosphotransferase ChpT
MTQTIDLRVAELLTARLCHDLIGPVAAIGNGAELLADEEPEFVRDAVALVGDSARKASVRLQFYRFAYGFSGGGLAGPPPHKLALELFEEGSIACEYRETVRGLPLAWQKLACNMLAIAGEALPRGGRLVIDAGGSGPELEASGEGAGPTEQVRSALTLASTVGELTSRTVGAYFTGLLADAVGCRLVADAVGCRLVVDARLGGFRLATAKAGAAV